MFLKTRTNDRFSLVYEGDPAVLKKEPENKDGDPADLLWIERETAEIVAGKKPDVIVCRPLNADESIRLASAVAKDQSMILFLALLVVIEINLGDGTKITEHDKKQEILNHSGNLQSLCALAAKILEVSQAGIDMLPFRGTGSKD